MRILSENGRFSTKTVGLGSLQFILRTMLFITLHKLYHEHLESLSLRSSETKIHRHLSIKAYAFLNAPHSSGQKRQNARIFTYWGLKELPMW